jgi:hypothetical protein
VSSAPHRVGILVYDGFSLLDVAGPAEVSRKRIGWADADATGAGHSRA